MIPAELKEKVPPHNMEAELAVLGAILLNPDAVLTAMRYLRPDDFYSNPNKNVYAAISSLFEKGQKADLITLSDEMRSLNSLDISGGSAYIAKLTDAVPSSANLEYYAKIVRDCSVRRRILQLSISTRQKVFDDSQDVMQLLDEIEESIFKVSDDKDAISYKPIQEVLPEVMHKIEELAKSKNPYTGLPTGFTELDDMTSGFHPSELIIIGARPSVGKTAFALNIATHMALKEKAKVAFFSLEMPDLDLGKRILASEARVDASRLRSGLMKPTDIFKLMESASVIYDARLFLVDVPNLKLLDLRTLARRMMREQQLDIIFIDYITLISHENQDLPRWEQISSISRSLKSLARELKIPIVVLSQLKREAEGKSPSMAEIRESGSIEQDADVIMFLHRSRELDKKSNERSSVIPTELILAKQRNGPVGLIQLQFLPSITRFESSEKGYN